MKMDKIELKYKNIGDIPLRCYPRLREIQKDVTLSDAERDIALLAILCDVDEDEIWGMSISEVQSLRLEAMKQTKVSDTIVPNKIVIGDWELDVVKDVDKIKYNEYVDFQTYWKDIDNNRAEILSTILIPNGHTYNDGYDIHRLINDIRDNITIHQFNVILGFFLQGLERLTKDFLRFLALQMKMKGMMVRNKEERKIYKEMAKELKRLQSSVGL